eukprot:g44228.t1
MGIHMGPSYAYLFVSYVEQALFSTYTGTVPQLFCLYIDDSISAASCTQDELEQFIDITNNFYPALKFTWSISETSLPYLDLTVSSSGNILRTNIYYEPTGSHSYLDFTSSHPLSYKNFIPTLVRPKVREPIYHREPLSTMYSVWLAANFFQSTVKFHIDSHIDIDIDIDWGGNGLV